MITYKLLVEVAGNFIPVVEDGVEVVFEVEDASAAGEHLAACQAEDGRCYAAEAVA